MNAQINLKRKAEDSEARNSESSQHMFVVVRIRPLSPSEALVSKPCCHILHQKCVVVEKDAVASANLKSQQQRRNEYAFDHAFGPQASQEDVYNQACRKQVKSVLDGYNLTIFAYGATGAGKTHTMMGSEVLSEEDRKSGKPSGVISYSIIDLFEHIRAKQELYPHQKWTVWVSYLEVYIDQIFDLLSDQRLKLDVREDEKKGVVEVSNLTEEEVHTAEQVLSFLQRGNTRRKTEPTLANKVSSRSHSVFQLRVRKESSNFEAGAQTVQEAKLSLIDLAGSEKAQQNQGERLREGSSINMSLLSLANCFNSLATGIGKPKFRDSKLTHLLKPSLTGHCRIIMIANINPSHRCYEDTHQTLKYANRAKNIKIEASAQIQDISNLNETELLQRKLLKLQEENEFLREAQKVWADQQDGSKQSASKLESKPQQNESEEQDLKMSADSSEEIELFKWKIIQLEELNVNSMVAITTLKNVCKMLGMASDSDGTALIEKIQGLIDELHFTRRNEQAARILTERLKSCEKKLMDKDEECHQQKDALYAMSGLVNTSEKRLSVKEEECRQQQEMLVIAEASLAKARMDSEEAENACIELARELSAVKAELAIKTKQHQDSEAKCNRLSEQVKSAEEELSATLKQVKDSDNQLKKPEHSKKQKGNKDKVQEDIEGVQKQLEALAASVDMLTDKENNKPTQKKSRNIIQDESNQNDCHDKEGKEFGLPPKRASLIPRHESRKGRNGSICPEPTGRLSMTGIASDCEEQPTVGRRCSSRLAKRSNTGN